MMVPSSSEQEEQLAASPWGRKMWLLGLPRSECSLQRASCLHRSRVSVGWEQTPNSYCETW